MAPKKAKKAAPKKAAAKKKSKKASPKKTNLESLATAPPEEQGSPCICVKAGGRWFCMKEVDDALIQCDGPFETRLECEAHVCI